MRVRTKLTAERAKALLSYDAATGVLTWIARSGIRTPIKVGDVAGSFHRHTGYMTVQVDGVSYPAHCVAWLMQTGDWPSGEIDHINGTKNDNRWLNLRDLPVGVNQQNRVRAQVNSKTGVLGVSKHPSGKYQASIKLNQKAKNLGHFETIDEARNAYLAAKRKFHVACTI